MAEVSLQRRYRKLLEEYLEHGDERQLRAMVELTHRAELILETTCGRVAASLEAAFEAYANAGARAISVDVHAPRRSVVDGEEVVTLRIPARSGQTVVIEIQGEHSGRLLPVVRLQCVGPAADDEPVEPKVRRPIEPRQLFDVLTELLDSAAS